MNPSSPLASSVQALLSGTCPPGVTPTAVGEALRKGLALALTGVPVHVRLVPSTDPWLEAARRALGDAPLSVASVEAVHQAWRALGPSSGEPERLVRLLDDAGRACAVRAWESLPTADGAGRTSHAAAAAVLEAMGSEDGAIAKLRQPFLKHARVVLVPTWQCELRCTYCTIPKQDGRVMSLDVAERGVDLLLSADAEEHRVHFYGGEPLLNWPVVHRAITYGAQRGAELDRKMSFQITTNTLGATDERLDALVGHDVLFQLSLDGTAESQRTNRPRADGGGDSYTESAAGRVQAFLDRGFQAYAIMVVSRASVGRLRQDFWHLAGLGVPSVQINYALGSLWTEAERLRLTQELFALGAEIVATKQRGGHAPHLVNLDEPLQEVRTNGHVTVDWDGTVYGSNSFLYTPALAAGQRLGHLDDRCGHDRYALDGFDREHLLAWSYRDKVTRNNTDVGTSLTTFVRWLGDQRADL